MNTPNEPSNPNRQQTAEDMKAKAGQAAHEVKVKAEQASREAKEKGREQLEEQESRAAETLNKVADATHAAAEQLSQRNETSLSRYVSEIADGIGKMSDNLQHKNTDELIQEASRLARQNTGLFLLGSVALGFGIARIAKANKSTGDGEASHWEDYYGQQKSGSYSAGASPGQTTSVSSPTHAGTSYLPEEGASTQNPSSQNPSPQNTSPSDSGSRSGPANNPGGSISR